MKKFLAYAIVAVLGCSTISAEVVTNETVLTMLSKGYPAEVIIGFIENADECQLNADMESIDALMAAGASTEVISYLMQKVKKDNTLMHGLYWMNNGSPEKVNIVSLMKESKSLGGSFLGTAVGIAGTAVGVSTGSIGALAGSWIAGDFLSSSGFKSEKLYLKGEHATTKTYDKNPVFKFVLPTQETTDIMPGDLWYYTWLCSVQSPSEFQLIKLDSKGKDKKAKRSFPSGLKWSTAGFSTEKEAYDNKLVEFQVKQLNNSTFEISFPNGLQPGEYAFFYRNALTEALKDHLSAFDFSVLE